MTKEFMQNVLNKIQEMEELLMRPLQEKEIDYLMKYSTKEFLYDYLQYTDKDIKSMKNIKKIISEYITPESQVRLENDDFESMQKMLFASNPIGQRVINALRTVQGLITDTLKPNIESKKEINSSDEPKDLQFTEYPIKSLLPESAKKWTDKLTDEELQDLAIITDLEIANDMLNHNTDEITDLLEWEDLFVGELMDKIKDAAVKHFIDELKEKKSLIIDDPEIHSEILSGLFKQREKVISNNNKIILV